MRRCKTRSWPLITRSSWRQSRSAWVSTKRISAAVFHFNLPKSLENYAQEIGRAGRDGAPSECEILACGEDLTVLENFTYGDTPTPEALRDLLKELLQDRAAGD